ncbi:SusE domain-containing protein [Spongiimicrobium salis]|uniref:SusE domain-containing protein n=1 Tax=Spongiimicrobium salis TaxID=1667022 RepID=UPI00374D50A8
MKKIITLSFAFMFILGLVISCDDDESFEFTLQPDAEGIVFLNDFSAQYLVSSATAANVAERLVYSPVDFGVPTAVSYELQSATDETFSGDFNIVNTTPETNVAITVRNLLDLAETLGLDQDPATTTAEGEPNNTGTVFFRIRAFAGNNNADTNTENISEVLSFNITLLEDTGDVGIAAAMASTFGIIYFDGVDRPDAALLTNEDGIHFGSVNIPPGGDGNVNVLGKFRENMDFAVNFGTSDSGVEGELMMGGFGNDIPFGAPGIAFIRADFNALTFTIDRTVDSWGMVGNTINDFGAAGPDIRLTEDPANPGVWVAFNVTIAADGVFKFRLNDDFAQNFGTRDGGAPNELMMGGFGNDIPITAGTFNVTLDLTNPGNETFTLEAQ